MSPFSVGSNLELLRKNGDYWKFSKQFLRIEKKVCLTRKHLQRTFSSCWKMIFLKKNSSSRLYHFREICLLTSTRTNSVEISLKF